nr:hypothetical protein 46 [bacterium]
MQNLPQTKIETLKLSDLLNIADFKAWIRKHINIYNEKEIPGEHITLFLDYIEKLVEEPDFKHDRGVWFEVIKDLKDRVAKHDRFEERH